MKSIINSKTLTTAIGVCEWISKYLFVLALKLIRIGKMSPRASTTIHNKSTKILVTRMLQIVAQSSAVIVEHAKFVANILLFFFMETIIFLSDFNYEWNICSEMRPEDLTRSGT